MNICVLGSGSNGNCIYLESGGTRLLVDAGLSRREIEARLASIGVAADRLDAILVSHEHGDHCSGLRGMQKCYNLPVLVNEPTAGALELIAGLRGVEWTIFRSEEMFSLGSLQVQPVIVSHDASEPVGFVITGAEGLSAGILTDLGVIPPDLSVRLAGCEILVIESNHDPDRLRLSNRPPLVKKRIAGDKGHLSNEAAAGMLADLAVRGLLPRAVFLAHLSADCNTPELATAAFAAVFRQRGLPAPEVRLTYRDRVSDYLCF